MRFVMVCVKNCLIETLFFFPLVWEGFLNVFFGVAATCFRLFSDWGYLFFSGCLLRLVFFCWLCCSREIFGCFCSCFIVSCCLGDF